LFYFAGGETRLPEPSSKRLISSIRGRRDDTKVPKLSGSSNANGTNLGDERRFVRAELPEDACRGSLVVHFKVKRVRLMQPIADRDTAIGFERLEPSHATRIPEPLKVIGVY
jgi:hypothetical protein